MPRRAIRRRRNDRPQWAPAETPSPAETSTDAGRTNAPGTGRPTGPSRVRRRRSRWPRWLVGLGLVLLLLGAAGLVGLRTLTDRYDHSVAKQLLLDPAARRERATVTGPLNYLLIGSDQRPAAAADDQRFDTIMIAHIPAGLDRAYLVSIPRDLLVPIPPSPATGYAGGSDKINSAFQHGGGGERGAQLLSATLTHLTGVRFDGAALIDFSGFRQVIDLIGGVQMCVDTEVRSVHTQMLFTRGCHQMSGAQALDYARQRYDLPNGDYDRQRHQQQLLRAVLNKVDAGNLVADPARLDQLIRAIGASFTVDTNGLPLEDLAFALRGIQPGALNGVRVPSRPEMIDEVSYVLLDQEATGLFRALRRTELAQWTQANPQWVNQL